MQDDDEEEEPRVIVEEEPTVVAGEEPTVVAEVEPTVVAKEEPTVVAEEVEVLGEPVSAAADVSAESVTPGEVETEAAYPGKDEL